MQSNYNRVFVDCVTGYFNFRISAYDSHVGGRSFVSILEEVESYSYPRITFTRQFMLPIKRDFLRMTAESNLNETVSCGNY